MDNMNNLQPSSEELEQSLMDLEPLLSVPIKEEILEETQENHVQNEKTAEAGVPAQSSGRRASQDGSGTKEDGAGGSPSDAAPTGGPWGSVCCVFCRRQLAAPDTEGTPRLMECLHSACERCVTAKLEEKSQSREYNAAAESLTVMCPSCRVNCSAHGMIDQQFVVERRQQSEGGGGTGTGQGGGGAGEQRCNSCSDDNAATAWCCECSEYICDVCVQAHQRLKITKDHTIKSKEEAVSEIQSATNNSSSTSQEMFCKEHTQERLSLFCETCDRLTCRDCQLLHHRDHRYQFSAEMAGAARTTITSLLSEVQYKRVLLGSAMKVIRDRQTLIADKKKALVHEITQTVVKLTNTINTRGKQLVLQLNEVCDAKQKTLNEKKVALEQLSSITDHCIEFVHSALEQGSNTAVLYTKKQVTSHLQRIKSRRADIPNPEIPVRIHLALEKVPDLIKVVSAIGAVVVDGKVYPQQGGSGGRPESAGPSPGQSQGPYHPPAPSPSATSALQAIHHHQAMVGAVMGGGQRPQQPSPVPHQQQQQFQQQQQQQPSQLAHLSHMSAQLQRQNSGGGIMGPLAGVVPQLRGVAAGAAGSIIRHPHVTSSTHPHHMAAAVDGVNYLSGLQQADVNLRGLLSATSPYSQQQQQQQQQQQANQRALQQANQYSRQALQAMQNYQGGAAYGQSPVQGVYGQRVGQQQQRPRAPSPHLQLNSLQQQQQHHQHQQQLQQQLYQQQQQHAAAAAKWHIPQNATNGLYTPTELGQQQQQHPGAPSAVMGGQGGAPGAAGGDSFKITIRQPPQARQPPATVTSTNPKTPSPNMHGMNATEAVAHSLDKFCQDSVSDLIATIAKLDSNGVQVLAENAAGGGVAGRGSAGAKGTSPLVHSSTDDTTPPPLASLSAEKQASGTGTETGAADPNEDWCAVCMDGGELMCCDKCPKVFHQYCHIPTIDKLPDETESWQCLLCVNFADIPEMSPGEKRTAGLTARQQKLIERIVLELYCQYEFSLHFREPVPEENIDYHSKIRRPMALDTIRLKLQPGNPEQYTHVSQLLADCRLMFRNAYDYNPPDSVVFKDAKRLEEFFDQQLEKWFPEYTYCSPSLLEDEQQQQAAKKQRLSSHNSANSITID